MMRILIAGIALLFTTGALASTSWSEEKVQSVYGYWNSLVVAIMTSEEIPTDKKTEIVANTVRELVMCSVWNEYMASNSLFGTDEFYAQQYQANAHLTLIVRSLANHGVVITESELNQDHNEFALRINRINRAWHSMDASDEVKASYTYLLQTCDYELPDTLATVEAK